jgi:hypothetical protein
MMVAGDAPKWQTKETLTFLNYVIIPLLSIKEEEVYQNFPLYRGFDSSIFSIQFHILRFLNRACHNRLLALSGTTKVLTESANRSLLCQLDVPYTQNLTS